MFGDVLKNNTKRTYTFIDKPKSIFSFLQRPKTRDLEVNISAAAECYDVARDSLWGHAAGT